MLRSRSLQILLIVMSCSGPAWSAPLILGLSDFREHVEAHRRRVFQLGMELHRLHPERYSAVDPGHLEEFLSFHDEAKTQDNLVTDLFSLFGRRPENERERAVIATVNEVDSRRGRGVSHFASRGERRGNASFA
jgi:hypothetical protein